MLIIAIVLVVSVCCLFVICLCQAAKRADEVIAGFSNEDQSNVKQT